MRQQLTTQLCQLLTQLALLVLLVPRLVLVVVLTLHTPVEQLLLLLRWTWQRVGLSSKRKVGGRAAARQLQLSKLLGSRAAAGAHAQMQLQVPLSRNHQQQRQQQQQGQAMQMPMQLEPRLYL